MSASDPRERARRSGRLRAEGASASLAEASAEAGAGRRGPRKRRRRGDRGGEAPRPEVDAARAAFAESAALMTTMADERVEATVRAAGVIRGALEAGGTVLAFGNGGSATDAEHLAAELVGRFRADRPGLAAVALTADSAVVTSVANDFGFDQVFRRQVESLGRPGDVAVAITTSGASPNVNLAVAAARARGLVTIGLTGRDGGETGGLVDVHVNVPSADTARVQEAHRAVLHVICELVEKRRA